MIIDWRILNGGMTTASSTDPGVENVVKDVPYKINNVNLIGTFICNNPANVGERSWAPKQTQIAIFDYFSADSILTSLLGEDKIFDSVPDNEPFPYVTLQIKPWIDRGNATLEGLESILTVHVWFQPGIGAFTGRGDKQVQLIQKRIDELLHKQHLVIEGWNTLILRRTFSDILTDPDNVTKHGIQQFKLLLGGN